MDNLVISGKPSIVIRVGSDFNLNGRQYTKGQIVCCLKDHNVRFTYGRTQKNITQGPTNILPNERLSLKSIYIEEVPMNKLLYNLIFKQNSSNFVRPYFEKKTTDNTGMLAVNHKDTFNLMVQDMDYNIIPHVADTDGIVMISHANKDVYVSYYRNCGEAMELKTKPIQLPYFTIECLATGTSIGDIRTNITQYIKVNRASLSMNPYFYFNDNIKNFDLSFDCLEDDGDKIIYG